MDFRTIEDGIRKLNKDIYARMDDPSTFASVEGAARLLFEVREAVDALEGAMKMTRSLHDLLRQAKAPDAFDAAGVSSISLDGYRFSRTSTMRASYREGMKVDALKWLRANELGDIIIDYVPPQTLAATARSMAEENQQLPDDYFTTYVQQNISITKVAK